VSIQIVYDTELTLSAPDGGVLEGVTALIEIEPKDAACIIYGWLSDGGLQPIQVEGARGELWLPFARPQIFVKHLHGQRPCVYQRLAP
jgi:hypothetical protein